MYIWIYLAVIFVFCGVSLFLFFFFRSRQKRKIDEFNRQSEVKSQPEEKKVVPTSEPESEKDYEFLTEEELARNKPTVEAHFEDFTLDDQSLDSSENFADVNLNSRRNSTLDDKFAEYEKFLNRHMNKSFDDNEPLFDDDGLFGELSDQPNFDDEIQNDDTDELDALANFDFDMLKGRSESEIETIIGSLPEKAQEIIRNDILGRKDVD